VTDLELPPMRPMPAGRQQWHQHVVMTGIDTPRFRLVPLRAGIAVGVAVILLAGGSAAVAHLDDGARSPPPLRVATASRAAPTGSPAVGTTALGPPCLPATPFTSVSGPLDTVLTASVSAPVRLGVRFTIDPTISVSAATVGVYSTATGPEGPPATAPPTTQPEPRAPVVALQQVGLTALVPAGQVLTLSFNGVTPGGQQLPPGTYSAWVTVAMTYLDCRSQQTESVQVQTRLAEVQLR